MNTSAEHIRQCNQSELLADASGRIADLMNENATYLERLICVECENHQFSTPYEFESSAKHNYRYAVHNYSTLPVSYLFTPVG